MFSQIIIISINVYSIHSCNIEIVEISANTYIAPKSSTEKKESLNSRNTAELLSFLLSEEEFLERKKNLAHLLEQLF